MMTEDRTAPTDIDMLGIPSPKDYWALHAHSVDWQILLQRLVRTKDPSKGEKPLDAKIAVIGMMQGHVEPIYYLSREYFTVQEIATLIGKPPESLAGIETLHLREFKDAEGKPAQAAWEKPSVDYWGMG
jgi:hypothetical protein